MQTTGGGATPQGLDARLLRFRSRPGSEDAVRLAEDLVAAGRAADALEVCDIAGRATPNDPRLMVAQGRALVENGELERAQAVLVNSARIDPRNKECFRALGDVLLRRNDPTRAIKVLERAAALAPDDRAIRMMLDNARRMEQHAESYDSAPLAEAHGQRHGESYDDAPTHAVQPVPDRGRARAAEPKPEPRNAGRTTVRRDPDPEPEPAPAPQAQRGRTLAYESPVAQPAQAAQARPRAQAPAPAAAPARGRDDFEDEATVVRQDGYAESEPEDYPTQMGPPPSMPRVAPGKNQQPVSPFSALVPPEVHKPAARSPNPTPQPAPRAVQQPTPQPAPRAVQQATPQPAPRAVQQPTPQPAPRAVQQPTPQPAPRAAQPVAREPVYDGAPQDTGLSASSLWDQPASEPPPPEPVVAPEPARTPAKKPASATVSYSDPSAAQTRVDREDRRPPPATKSSSRREPFAEENLADAPPSYPPPRADATEDVIVDEPDASWGEKVGTEEDVDAILQMLEHEGIFEPPSGAAATWATRKEVQKTGSRLGRTLAVVWIAAVVLSAGGYYGWTQWVAHRHQQAAELVANARKESKVGDHEQLVDAERHLLLARDLDPRASEGPTLLLLVHAQRALEDGAFDAGYLRPTVQRAEKVGGDPGMLEAARAVLSAAQGMADQTRQHLREALQKRPNDAGILYIAGRLEQRLGDDTALAHLEAAVQKDASFSAAAIALAEVRADEGNREAAMTLIQDVLRRHPTQLRAALWRAYLEADDADPPRALAALTELAKRLDKGAPTDRVLVELTRARLQRRKGDVAAAGETAERAISAGATEPRLLALVAVEARGAGRLAAAQRAATQAVTGAPTNGEFRKLLGGILLARRDGRRALEVLRLLCGTDPNNPNRVLLPQDPDAALLYLKATLMEGSQSELTSALTALDQYLAQNADAAVEVKALRVRTRAALGQAAQALTEANALVQAAPGDPAALLAQGEAALAARDGATALRALEQVVRADPDDVQGHYLLGRAKRLSGSAQGAEVAFRRALELASDYVEARIALGSLLLERGDYTQADDVYQDLVARSGATGGVPNVVLGRLGRIEALIGLGRLDDATVQYDSGLHDQDRDYLPAIVVAARLALAKGRPGEAVSKLRPLPGSERKTPEILSLYGDALVAAGQGDVAVAQYDAALAMDAELPEALVGRGVAAVRAERGPDALAYATRAEAALRTRIRPDAFKARVFTLLGRAALLVGHDEAERARAALTTATNYEDAPHEAFFFFGEAFSSTDSPRARAAYERYLQLEPEGEFADRARRAAGGH